MANTPLPGSIRLIVNADDFGFTRDVNEGIAEAHRHGILTATTLMANGSAFQHAIALAGELPTLDIGCHLTLVQGQSVLDPGRELPATLSQLIRAMIRGDLKIYDELAAQVRKILDSGIAPTHLDTHKHTHLLPPVLDAVARIAREFSIPWIRRPFDIESDPAASPGKRMISSALRLAWPRFSRALGGLRTTDHFTGFQLTGILNSATLVGILESLPAGITELMCHPGRYGPELQSAATRLKASREIELAALISPEARAVIQRRKIELTNYRSVS